MAIESDTSESIHARVGRGSVISASLPDAADPDLSAVERARLAGGSLALTDVAPLTMPQTGVSAQLRRFKWPLLQPRLSWIYITLALLVLGYVGWQITTEFVISWELGLVPWLYGLAALISLDLLMARAGEQVPWLGRSWIQVGPKGVRMRLFYGRKPGPWGKGFRLHRLIWPCRVTISWPDVARVAVYCATYDSGGLPWYRVKLWTRNGSGYVALITQSQVDANQLCNLLVQSAHLSRWATLDGDGGRVINPTLGDLDRDTLTLWKADQRRMKLPKIASQISAEIWRADGQPFIVGPWLTWRTIVKLIIAVALLLVILNYDYLLSYVLWTPPAPITSDNAWIGDHHDAGNTNASNQTLIPPLHEVWQAKVPSYSAAISLGGNKLLAISGTSAYVYDATSGSLLKQFYLPGVVYDGLITYNTISSDGNRLYFISGRQVQDTTYGSINFNDANEQSINDAQLNAFDLNNGSTSWQHPLGSSTSFVLDPQHNLIITGSPITATISGTVQSRYVIEAVDPQTGAQIWHSESFKSALQQIVVGGDTVYASIQQPGDTSATLAALAVSNGATLWQKNVNKTFDVGFTLLADANYVYALTNYASFIYSNAGVEQVISSSINPTNVPAVLVGGRIIFTRNGGLISAIPTAMQPFGTYHSPYSYLTDIEEMSASKGLLFIISDYSSNMLGKQRLLAFDLGSGRLVWRSPAFNNGFGSPIIIGNGMLYLVHDGEIHAFAGARLAGHC